MSSIFYPYCLNLPSYVVLIFTFCVLCVMLRAFVFLVILLYLVYVLIVFWKFLRYVISGSKDGTEDEFPKI
jgi:heme A synthase